MKKFTYQWMYDDTPLSTDVLNAMGEAGYELVTVLYTENRGYQYYFKKEEIDPEYQGLIIKALKKVAYILS